jgi:energy-converting hydrogenase Eha subunit F
VSRSRYKRRSNRSAKILTTAFSVVFILVFILGLLGPYTFQRSDEPTPIPTRVFFTATPLASPTPTTSIPTPVVVTPTTSP